MKTFTPIIEYSYKQLLNVLQDLFLDEEFHL